MTITSEPALGLAVMQVLSKHGDCTVQKLIEHVPVYVNLTLDDLKRSGSRANEQMWEQRVRNLKSHEKTAGNVIGEGFMEHIGQGHYRLTKAGFLHLQRKGLI